MIKATGKPMAWREGLTVQDVLDSLGDTPPGAIVLLDSKPVPLQKWAATPVPDGAEVAVYPMMAGG